MTADILGPFRDEALARGIPAGDVGRWIGIARPCATLTPSANGPVVARFGGSLMLPVDAPNPWFPLVATIDCEALPPDATDLPLPPDGQLLLFAFPLADEPSAATAGEALHVPAGTTVGKRENNPYFYGEIPEYEQVCRALPQGELRLATNVSLPHSGIKDVPEPPYSVPLPGHPRSEELVAVWWETRGKIASDGPLQIGGYGTDESGLDPVTSAAEIAADAERAGYRPTAEPPDADDWVLLADWYPDVRGLEGTTVHWAIPRADLAARRFERTHVTTYWNP
ncbi:hypothetical protein [Actinosynnema sp. NPDC023587]|uniref:hypothetical protein n=1 Tax=Actinosynnema sp. NPDC023587 TaxID=3154695 RepID=UPI0033F1E2B2